ncbi:MAG: hypothetical protein QXL96_08035 [Ignisphaera sp.]
MTNNEPQGIEVEFYIPHEIRLNDIVTITLYRKASTEILYEPKDILDNFQKNEDFFISWLSNISSSKGYPVVRATVKVNGTIIEALHSSDKLNYFIDFPYISRIKRIYVIQKLKSHESMLNTSASQEEENPHLITNQQNNISANIIQDLSNDELYVFFNPINVIDPSKADALVLETDRGIIFLRLDNVPRISLSTTTTKTATTRKKKRKSSKKKKKKRKTRKRSKSSS